MDLGISIMIIGAAAALLCIIGGALGGIAVGLVWASRRPGIVPQVRALLRTGGVGEEK